jgi:hypothetical protein
MTTAKKTSAAKKTTKAAATKKPAVKSAAPAKADRTFHATAVLAAQAAKDTPKSAVMRVASGFYTGSKRAGVKAGAEFMGRVATVLAAKKAKKQATAA